MPELISIQLHCGWVALVLGLWTTAAFAADTRPPTVRITSPKANARLTNHLVTVQGTASDAGGLAVVQYRWNGGEFQDAVGTTTWSAMVEMTAGTNLFEVKSIDTSSLTSVVASIKVVFVVPSSFTLTPPQGGTVTPTPAPMLEVGRGYALTAKPAPGNILSNWTGSVLANPITTSKINFIMVSNGTLQVNFITNVFRPTKGTYNGLFTQSPTARHETSGTVLLTLTESGAFTGTLILAGKRHPLKGQFSLVAQSLVGEFARASIEIPRPGTTMLQVELALFPDGSITGLVNSTDSEWAMSPSTLSADRAVFSMATGNPCPQKGKYTVVFPGSDYPDDPLFPEGWGYGTVAIDGNGKLKLAGTLGDGTKITHTATVSAAPIGAWPLYLSLYGGKGSLLGYITFDFDPTLVDDFNGLVTWTKPPTPAAKYYPAGFEMETFAAGSIYIAPSNPPSPVIQVVDPKVELSKGNLDDPLITKVSLSAANKVAINSTDTSGNKLTMTITSASGLIKGGVTPAGETKPISFGGVIFQKQQIAYGFFLGTNQSGNFYFGD